MAEFDPQNLNVVRYAAAVPELRNGDLALFRSKSWHSNLIKIGSLGIHSHAAMLRINGDDRIDLLEMVEGAGGRAKPLRARVQEQSGQCDIFRPDTDRWPELDLAGATAYMRDLTGLDYGTWGVMLLAGLRMAGLRFLLARRAREFDDARESGQAPFCSHAVSTAYRIGGGVDPVPRKPDYLVTPADLCCSLLFQYHLTLTH